MKKDRVKRWWPASLLSLALLLGCTGNGTETTEKENLNVGNDMQTAASVKDSVIMDDHYKNGFNLLGVRSIDTGDQVMDVLNYGQPYGVYPFWRLAQWGTRYSLEGTRVSELSKGVYTYANDSKAVTVDTNTSEVTLKVLASLEYERPRRSGEDWPHLLMEQHFQKTPFLDTLEALRIKASVRITQADRKMTDDEYDPSLHAAQVSWYLTIQNKNSSSTGYGDYFWFGLPLYDNRDPLPKESYFQDGGKVDTTSKFIYNMSAETYLTKGLEDGEWATIELDILSFVLKARDLAYESGFLATTNPEDLALSNMNLGWELPGTFDVEMQVKDLQIIAKPGSGLQE